MAAKQTLQSMRASEDIFNSILQEATSPGTSKTPAKAVHGQSLAGPKIPVPDVSKTEVPDAFLSAVLEFTNKKSKDTIVETVEVEEVEEVNEAAVITSKVQDLVVRLASLIKEARTVIEEMTSVGMVGVGKATGFKKPVKKVNGPTKATKRN